MIRRMKYGFLIAGLLLCCLFAGYYFGYCQGKGIGPGAALRQSTGQEEEKITYNKTIAIVNLDEGIQLQGKQENYAVRLIDTITDDVVVTGLEDARRGIESGTYSAYMVIPAAFSEQISTITTQPVKSEIAYALGRGLAGEEREAVIYRMESIFRLFNNNMSKVYLSSVLESYHEAQDSASDIISNDTQDMELLLQIRGENLTEHIETPQATIVEKNIPKLDLTDHYTENSRIIEQISTAYQRFNQKGTEAIELIKDDFTRTEEMTGKLQGEMTSMGETIEAFDAAPWDDSEQAEKEDAFYQAKKEALTSTEYLDGDKEEKEETVSGNEGGEESEKRRPKGILTAYNASLQEEQEKLLLAFLDGLREETALPEEEEQETYVEEFLEEQDGIPPLDIGLVNQEMDALIQTAKDSRALRNEELEKRLENLEQIREQVQEQMKMIRASHDEINTAYEETKNAMAAFNLSSFIDDAEINGYLQQMKDSLRGVETKVENQIAAYEEYTARVYEAAENDIRSFEEEIARGQEQSEKKLMQGLEGAKNSRQENNENNVRLLNELMTQMPYTRIGEVENREVYDFIAEPILTNNQSEAKKEVQEKEGIKSDTVIFITVFCVLILLSGGAQIVAQRRKIREQWK